MSRYIDSNELCKRVFKDGKGFDYKNGNSQFILGVKSALEIIHDMPTEDVAPIIHAHWIDRNGNVVYPDSVRYECSNCKGHGYETDYCPHCGARMDEEEENG